MDPAELEAARDALLARVTDHFRADDSTRAIFLAGSLAEGTADAWSDIDLRVVTTSEAFARVTAARRTVAKTWGDWLFDVWDDARPNVCVSHYAPLTKIDVLYYRPEDLMPSPWYARPLRVLHDPGGLVVQLIERSREVMPVVSVDELRLLASKAISYVHEIERRLSRGELLYAQSLVCGLRDHIIRFDNALADRLTASAPVARFEHQRSASPDLVHALAASLACGDRELLSRALDELVTVLRPRLDAAPFAAEERARFQRALTT
jgi:predicted nucleotidyltransferase